MANDATRTASLPAPLLQPLRRRGCPISFAFVVGASASTHLPAILGSVNWLSLSERILACGQEEHVLQIELAGRLLRCHWLSLSERILARGQEEHVLQIELAGRLLRCQQMAARRRHLAVDGQCGMFLTVPED